MSYEGLLPHRWYYFAVSSHGRWKTPLGLCYQGTNPIPEGSTSWPNHFPSLPPGVPAPHSISLGDKFATHASGLEHEDSDHSSLLFPSVHFSTDWAHIHACVCASFRHFRGHDCAFHLVNGTEGWMTSSLGHFPPSLFCDSEGRAIFPIMASHSHPAPSQDSTCIISYLLRLFV